ncbi:serine hydrolase domain-containing protein [Kineosporia babensis]|uniref:Beta-lactamase family protein n=1 Tax=Kineosporia babensis TaxID=499548 RepID=A0A9X1NK63_9ACTN|nr:serine hydrolase domain-containing protein [Kineosporia babensis]MCD5315094.1 beta-lactamase family protein [Kineosporia babensis]
MKRSSSSHRLGRSATAAFALAAVLTGTVLTAVPASAAAGDHHNDLQHSVDALVKAGAVGTLVRVDDGHKLRTATAGLADRETKRRLKNKDQYEAGSQTKTFVAVLTLQLAAQGKLKLDAPVEKYLPGVVPNGQKITVRMLLQHTSGLFNYTEDEQAFKEILADPEREATPQELLEVGFRNDPYFAPGQGWHYSNTGYIVLGEMLHQVTGQPVKTLIQQKIAKPLRLRDTYLADPKVANPGPGFAHGYLTEVADGRFSYADTSQWSLSWAGSAGAVVSTARDLSTFYSTLLGGDLLPKAQLNEMKKTVDLSEEWGAPIGYGLGLYRQETPCGTGWGHDGGTLGHNTTTLVSSDGKRSVAGDVNNAFVSSEAQEDPALERFALAQGQVQLVAVCAMFGKEVPAQK